MRKRSCQMTRFCVALVLTWAVASNMVQAQESSVFFHVACYKAQPAKALQFQEFLTTEGRRLAEAGVGQGQLVSWTASRVVIPRGEDADCDFTTARVYQGMPSSLELTTEDAFAQAKMNQADVWEKLNSMAHLVNTRLWRLVDSVGEMSEGDYYTIDLMHAPEVSEWEELETKVYKPVHEERDTSGGPIKGWSAYALVLPGGSGREFNVGTLNVLKDLKSFGAPAGYEAAFAKVHPGVNPDWIAERTEKARDIVQTILSQTIAKVDAQ